MKKLQPHTFFKTGVAVFIIIFSVSGCYRLFPYSSKRIKSNIAASGFMPHPDSMYNATKNELDIYDFKPHETIADVGFGMAWLEGVIVVHYDSLTIYANDVADFAFWYVDTIIASYLTLRKTPNTNQFITVKGTEYATNLPENTFDKIIVRETFHHFTKPYEMLADIHSKLKPEGKLFVYEEDQAESYFNKQCEAIIYCRKDLLAFFDTTKWKLADEHVLTDSPGSIPSWWLEKGEKTIPKRVYVFQKR